MKKKLCDMSRADICDTCEKYSNGFMGDCDKSCPFYDKIGFSVHKGKEFTHCKTSIEYLKKHPNEEIELEGEK